MVAIRLVKGEKCPFQPCSFVLCGAKGWLTHTDTKHEGKNRTSIIHATALAPVIAPVIAPVPDYVEEEEDEYEDVEQDEPINDATASALELMHNEIAELKETVKNLVISVKNVNAIASSYSTPVKGPSPFQSAEKPTPVKKGSMLKPKKVELEGIVDTATDPVGKLLLQNEFIPRVVYLRHSKQVYYSPTKTGELALRFCSLGQVGRIKDLTPEELELMGYEYQYLED